ncbi:hypothetical protein Pmani_013503 [Petrolisthes manimaculis]|uniref:Uncharacterized protein n=1 Tax=Petrolisthes manimaculis TaxID=1843537 RepID=A0AAE1PVK4_9EUCA|nr:hypothetical protein Pmani_013503 [Petrolisthes manimaculis]
MTEKGYAEVVPEKGLGIESENGVWSRVASLKSVTIPRLELTAATLAVRVNDVIVNALEIPVGRINFWTDSTAVLRYIRNTKSRFHTSVANRLAVIHDGSGQDQWRHVPSCENPADKASRL